MKQNEQDIEKDNSLLQKYWWENLKMSLIP